MAKVKTAVFVGRSRPQRIKDMAMPFVKAINKTGCKVVAIFYYPNDKDNIKAWAKEPAYLMPSFLRGKKSEIENALKNETKEIEAWKKWYETLELDFALTFYAGWLPDFVYENIPKGCVNFHPAPLPALKGFEPETMAIMKGFKTYFGTFHEITSKYDAGKILWHTPYIKIKNNESPSNLLRRVTKLGIKTVPRGIKYYINNKIKGITQNKEKYISGSLEAIRKESVIDWRTHTLEDIERKNCAFNKQQLSIDLLTVLGDKKYIIKDIKVLSPRKPSIPGTIIGKCIQKGAFFNMPVIHALDGEVVVKLKSWNWKNLNQFRKSEQSSLSDILRKVEYFDL